MFTTELQYAVVRYMFNDLADEAANVALLAASDDPPRFFFRVLQDPTVKSRNDASLRRETVDRFTGFVKDQIQRLEAAPPAQAPPPTSLLTQLRDATGSLIRITLPRSVLTNDLEREVDLLFQQWVAPARPMLARRTYSPRDPLSGLRHEATRALIKAFREGYGHPLSRKLFSRSYQVRGALHTSVFDLAVLTGTKKKQREHLFHHLLVLPDPEDSFTQAAGLCWRWSDITALNDVDRRLTAVLYERRDRRSQNFQEAARLLRKQQIDVTPIHELSSVVRRLGTQGQLALGS